MSPASSAEGRGIEHKWNTSSAVVPWRQLPNFGFYVLLTVQVSRGRGSNPSGKPLAGRRGSSRLLDASFRFRASQAGEAALTGSFSMRAPMAARWGTGSLSASAVRRTSKQNCFISSRLEAK